MFARQINDFETHTYAIPETTLILLQPFIEIKTIQENNSIFVAFFFSFFEQIQQNKYTPTLAFWYTTIQIRSIRT